MQPVVTLTNTYDPFSNRTALADSLGGTAAFLFDGADRLTRVTAAGGAAVDLAYDAAGRVTGITYPNTVQTAAGRAQKLDLPLKTLRFGI